MKCAFENVKKSYPEAFCRGFTNDKDILPRLRGFSLVVDVTTKVNYA